MDHTIIANGVKSQVLNLQIGSFLEQYFFMSQMKIQNQEKIHEEVLLKDKVKPPSMYHVVMLNDDYTTMDFVIWILQEVFYKSASESQEIMLAVHTKGKCQVGTYTYDVAKSKVIQVKELAKKEGYPLTCDIREDNGIK